MEKKFAFDNNYELNHATLKSYMCDDIPEKEGTGQSDNMACVIAGGAGDLKRGHHVATAGKHPLSVLITLLNAVGGAYHDHGRG